MKVKLLLISFLFIQFAFSQNITFSDSNFKLKLLSFDPNYPIGENLAGEFAPIDANNDKEISFAEALNVSSLQIFGDEISNIQGLQYFTNLKTLRINTDFVQNINLSTLVNLERLFVGTMDLGQTSPNIGILTSLDLSKNTKLNFLFIVTSTLSTLDLTKNVNLTELYVRQEKNDFVLNIFNLVNLRKLTYTSAFNPNLDISTCTNLIDLEMSGSGFSSIDVSNQSILSKLSIVSTNITSLNLSKNLSLEIVVIVNNRQLTSLNLGTIQYVTSLFVNDNNLTTLNTNNLPYLQFLDCSNNKLTEVFIKNTSFETYINLDNNANLVTVCCDNVQIIPVRNILNRSGQFNVTVTSNCDTAATLELNSFRNNSEIILFPNPASKVISLKSNLKIDKIEIYDLNGRKLIETSRDIINIENIQSGFYFAKVFNQNNSQILKFLKE